MKPRNGLPVCSINNTHSINNNRLEYRRMWRSVSTCVLVFILMTSGCSCYDNSEQSKVLLEISEEIPVGSVVVNLLNYVNEKPEVVGDHLTQGQFSFVLVTKNKMHEQLFQLEEGFSDKNSSSSPLPSSSSSLSSSSSQRLGNGILTVKSRIDREILCRRRTICEIKLEVEVEKSRRSRKVRSHKDHHHDQQDGRTASRMKREVVEQKVGSERNYYPISLADGYDGNIGDGGDDKNNKKVDLLQHQQWKDNTVLQNQHHHRRRHHLSENNVTTIHKKIPSPPIRSHHGESTSSSHHHGVTILDPAINSGRHDNQWTKDHEIIGRDSNHVLERSGVIAYEVINSSFIRNGTPGSLGYGHKSKNNNRSINENNNNNNNNNRNNNNYNYKNNNDESNGNANPSRVKRDTESETKHHASVGIPSTIPKIRTARDYFFQIIEIIIIITDINDNPPQFVVDESDLSLARSAAEASISEHDRNSKWENQTALSFSVYVAENSPKGHSFVIPCYVEDPDISDHINRDGHASMTFEHEGNCSDLIMFSVKTESESETYTRRGKRSEFKSFHHKNQQTSLQDHHHHHHHPSHLTRHHVINSTSTTTTTTNHHHQHHHVKNRIKRQQGTTTSLWLTVLQELDRESIDRCYVDVRAKDSAGNVGKLLRLRVIVTDVNDNKPVFESETTRLEIPEDRPPSLTEPIVRVKASDLDIGENGRIVYTFARATQTSLGWLFHIDSDSGKIFLKSRMNTGEAASGMSTIITDDVTATSLDDDKLRSTSSSSSSSSAPVETKGFKLRVVASNPVPGSVTSSQHDVIVVPMDVNDHSPHVRISPDPIEVTEEAESIGQVVGHVMVEDMDSGENGRTRCAFSNWSHLHHHHQEDEDYEEALNDEDDDDEDYDSSDLFRLIRVSEKMYRMVTKRKFDREKRAKFKVTLFCWDHGTPRLSTSRDITVVIRDINDNWPTFRQKSYQVDLAENNHVGAAILKVMADDVDEGANARIIYSISAKPNDKENNSTFNSKNANNITNKNAKNISKNKSNEKTSSSASTKAIGNVPTHSSLTTSMTPNYDDDSIESMFSIDSESGIIYAMKSFDYEAVRQFHFYVLAGDGDGYDDKRSDDSGETFVTVNILDVNDEPPLFSSEKHEFFVVENGPPETEVGVVMVTDADASPAFVSYNLTVESSFPPPTSGGSFFHLDETTGRLVTSRTLDREQYSVHHLWLVVRNTATPHLSSTSHVIVHVTDTNDNAPLVEYPSPGDHSVQVRCSANPGNIVARIRARDADAGENATLEYSVAKGNDAGLISVETKNGLVTLVRPPLDLLEFKMAADRQNRKRTTDEFYSNSNWTNGVEMKFEVVFVVRDQGEPPKSAETRLEILINCSLADLQRRTGKDTKSDEFLNFFVNTAGFQSDSFKKMFTNELIVAIFGAITAVLLVATMMVVCVRLRRNSRSGHRSLDRNNSKSGLSDSDFKLNISNKMTSQMTSPVSASENHYHVTPGATRLTSGGGVYHGNHHGGKCSDVHSSVKEDNIKNEMLLMNRSKMEDDDVINNKMAAEDDVINNKMAVKGYDYHTSQTLEKNNKQQANGMKSFSPPPRSDHGSLTKRSEVITPATTSGFSTFFSPPPPAPPPSHTTCCMEKKQLQQQHQQQHQQQQQQCNNYMQQQQQQCGYHGSTFQKNQMRPSLKLLRQEMTLTETDKRKESLVSANEVNRLLDILKSSHDNQGHYSSCDWPPIEDFNQSDIIWGQCVDDVIDDYDICNPEYEKL